MPDGEHTDPKTLLAMPLEDALGFATEGEGYRPILVCFDQLEQVLTTTPHDVVAKQHFFAAIGSLLVNEHVWAIFVIREDYLAALDPYLRYFPNRLRTRFRLDLLDSERRIRGVDGNS